MKKRLSQPAMPELDGVEQHYGGISPVDPWPKPGDDPPMLSREEVIEAERFRQFVSSVGMCLDDLSEKDVKGWQRSLEYALWKAHREWLVLRALSWMTRFVDWLERRLSK